MKTKDKIDLAKLLASKHKNRVPNTYYFNSPYSYKQEVIYISKFAMENIFGMIAPEETVRVTYIGLSYLDDGNLYHPRAIIQLPGNERKQIRVPFTKIRKIP